MSAEAAGKGKPLSRPGLPVVTITLTAGTASEINCWGVISNPETQEKIGFGDPMLNPVLAIVDPKLMRTIPGAFIRRIRALTRCSTIRKS